LAGIVVSSPLVAFPLSGQAPVDPVLAGQVLLASEPLPSITVVLHRVAPDGAGELDSIAATDDGSFAFRLPHVPDPELRGEIFFASVRYRDVLYFGPPVSQAVQLDSVYVVQAYDTAAAPPDGARLPVRIRHVFLEPAEGGWQVTDLFQVHNPGDRTLIAGPDDATWTHPLLEGGRDFELGQGDLAPEQVDFADGSVRVTAPLPPGDRLVVVRYRLDEVETVMRIVGATERAEVLILEPAPLLDVVGLDALDTVELEPGTSYRRYQATDLMDATIRMVRTEPPRGLPTGWLAVLMALVLAGAGVLAFRQPFPRAAAAGGPGSEPSEAEDSRRLLLLEIAKLDEAYAASESGGSEAEAQYRAKRADLIRRLGADSAQ
jgi:hypothetical protein